MKNWMISSTSLMNYFVVVGWILDGYRHDSSLINHRWADQVHLPCRYHSSFFPHRTEFTFRNRLELMTFVFKQSRLSPIRSIIFFYLSQSLIWPSHTTVFDFWQRWLLYLISEHFAKLIQPIKAWVKVVMIGSIFRVDPLTYTVHPVQYVFLPAGCVV